MVAAALPAKSVDLEMVLLLAISVLDPIVEQDYVLVYVHSGLTSDNRPTFAFLKKCYKIFNRKYKKNLKRLYIVHPTFWVRTSFKLFRPFLSAKFWRKLTYIDNVEELDKTIDRSEITLPRVALQHITAAQPAQRVMGVPLAEVCARQALNGAASSSERSGFQLPFFLEQSLLFLRGHAKTDGILRLSGSILEIKKLSAALDEGQFDVFNSLSDPHVVGGFVKLWMRELPDPVISHAVYDKFVTAAREAPPNPAAVSGLDEEQPNANGPSPVSAAVLPVLQQLPDVNRRVLAALLDLCGLFHLHRADNRMTARNLGIVMAPNLLSCPGHDMAITLQNTPLLNETVRWLIIDHAHIVPSLKN